MDGPLLDVICTVYMRQRRHDSVVQFYELITTRTFLGSH